MKVATQVGTPGRRLVRAEWGRGVLRGHRGADGQVHLSIICVEAHQTPTR
jgi:hypothetical protein